MTVFSMPPPFAFFSTVGEGVLSDTDGISQGVSCSVSGVLPQGES